MTLLCVVLAPKLILIPFSENANCIFKTLACCRKSFQAKVTVQK